MALNVRPVQISASTRKERLELADRLEKLLANDKNWYEFPTPQDYRDARRNGTHGFKKAVCNDKARLINFTGREGNSVELRVIEPTTGPSKGVWLHFHAGGFVIGSNASYDTYLTRLSNELGLTMASVEYRLAPENPYPAGYNDAVDAALFALSEEGASKLGAQLRVLGGESAGGWYAVAVALALRDKHGVDVQSQLFAICAGYGIFDLTYTPSCLNHKRNIVLSSDLMQRFAEAAFAHIPLPHRKVPDISLLYADLKNLPPAQFLVGTIEPLIDDSMFMAAKWANFGNEVDLHIVDGGCHAFTLIPMGDATEEGLQSLISFTSTTDRDKWLCSVSEAFLLQPAGPIPKDKIIFEEAITGKTITYHDFKTRVLWTACWLKHDLSIQPGEVVTITSPSCIDYIVASHAIWWLGGVVSMMNDALSLKDMTYALDLVRPKVILAGPSVIQKVTDSVQASSLPASAWRIVPIDYTPTCPHSVPDSPGNKHTYFKPYSLKGKDNRDVLGAIVLSSGTTGYSKAAMISHHNLIAINYQLRADNPQNWRHDMREVFFPPLAHIYATYAVINGAPWLGSYICLLPRFDLEIYMRLMSARKATLARLVPPVAKLLADSTQVGQYDFSSLEYFSCSAAPLSDKVASKLRNAFPHVVLCQTYGCTEASGACVQSGVQDKNMASNATGKAISNLEMRFLDESGNDVKAGEPGEITLRGPNIMMGYLRDPEATAKDMLEGGWYKTGDLGYVNEDGYLILKGRLKDTIKYNGFQVSPVELEEILTHHSAVEEVAVCGIWNEEASSDLVRAYVVLKQGFNASPDTAKSISQFLNAKVSGYKQLRGGVVFVDGLPKSSTGKVLKRILKDMQQGSAKPKQSLLVSKL
ncbi:lipase esterase [Fusarium mundagurra]|uniref:Lipase esterase n=1 Tax=Fusarium mundagurra TaxID=1567541 RepID=A0A8H5YF64_9HYPO|nr:lipase esterase [Fusarium mundagurra]